MLKRRSWAQFSGEQELDSAGTLEQACYSEERDADDGLWRRHYPGLKGGTRRLVELYLHSVEATEARSKLAKRTMEASTQHLFAKP